MPDEQPSRVAVVTGASAGIGLGVARRLAADGYLVAGVSRGGGPPEPGVTHLRGDVADPAQVQALTETVLRTYGRVDALVNSAGTMARRRLEELDAATLTDQLGTNLLGTVHTCRALLPALSATAGSVVNVSSALAESPIPGVAAYAAAKGGVEAFSRALALEAAEVRVRVNVVRPALVRSEIWVRAGMPPEDYEDLLARRAATYPLGRVGEPADVAAAVAFLLSPEASWITGVTLPVDGGSGLAGTAPHPDAT